MKVDFDQKMLDGDGEAMPRTIGYPQPGQPQRFTDMTLGWSCQNAVWAASRTSETEQALRYAFGLKIGRGVVEITDEEAEMIRTSIIANNALSAGQVLRMLSEAKEAGRAEA